MKLEAFLIKYKGTKRLNSMVSNVKFKLAQHHMARFAKWEYKEMDILDFENYSNWIVIKHNFKNGILYIIID